MFTISDGINSSGGEVNDVLKGKMGEEVLKKAWATLSDTHSPFSVAIWLQSESSILLPNIVIKNSGEPCVVIYEEFTSSVGLCGVFITMKYHKTSVSSHFMT